MISYYALSYLTVPDPSSSNSMNSFKDCACLIAEEEEMKEGEKGRRVGDEERNGSNRGMK